MRSPEAPQGKRREKSRPYVFEYIVDYLRGGVSEWFGKSVVAKLRFGGRQQGAPPTQGGSGR